MGVDLAWLVAGGQSMDHNYCPTMIEVGRDYDYHDKIRELRTFDPPKYFGCHVGLGPDGDYAYGALPETDPYGEPYRVVKAGDLATIEHEPRYDTLAAAMAYVRAINPDTMIVLHWH